MFMVEMLLVKEEQIKEKFLQEKILQKIERNHGQRRKQETFMTNIEKGTKR